MTPVSQGKPYAGNLHVRFEEGASASANAEAEGSTPRGGDVESTGGAVRSSSISNLDPGEILDVKWRLAVHESAVDQVLSNPLIETRSKYAYRALLRGEESLADIAERYGFTPNALSQLKARFDRAIAAAEASFGS